MKEHEKLFEAACDYATQLASGDNVRSGDLLLAKVLELQELWEELKTEVERRDSLLQQAQLAQQVCMCAYAYVCVCVRLCGCVHAFVCVRVSVRACCDCI